MHGGLQCAFTLISHEIYDGFPARFSNTALHASKQLHPCIAGQTSTNKCIKSLHHSSSTTTACDPHTTACDPHASLLLSADLKEAGGFRKTRGWGEGDHGHS